MWNNRFVVRQSEHFAERLAMAAPEDLSAQVALGCELAFGRLPTASEKTEMMGLAKENGLPNLCRVLLNSNEFIFVH
ncbi:hypothetical protein D3C83_174960 [compost metagenome]